MITVKVTSEMLENLDKCPCCGSRPNIAFKGIEEQDGDEFICKSMYVVCPECGLRTSKSRSYEMLKWAWNHRPENCIPNDLKGDPDTLVEYWKSLVNSFQTIDEDMTRMGHVVDRLEDWSAAHSLKEGDTENGLEDMCFDVKDDFGDDWEDWDDDDLDAEWEDDDWEDMYDAMNDQDIAFLDYIIKMRMPGSESRLNKDLDDFEDDTDCDSDCDNEESSGGYRYNFPTIECLPDDGQAKKIAEEAEELVEAGKSCSGTDGYGYGRLLEETLDCIQACETLLHMYSDEQIKKMKDYVIFKNEQRGYYI